MTHCMPSAAAVNLRCSCHLDILTGGYAASQLSIQGRVLHSCRHQRILCCVCRADWHNSYSWRGLAAAAAALICPADQHTAGVCD